MTQSEWFTSYLEYESLKDMLKVILYSAQSTFAFVPMLYHIKYNERDILFIQTGMVGGVLVHYLGLDYRPEKKFIKLDRLTGDYNFEDNVGTDAHALYIPILELKRSTLRFPE
jgi:hypothetical protein